MTIEEKVVQKLIERKYHISFAESCTGGMCCAKIVNVSNASSVLDMSFVTYANEAKIDLLGVDSDVINKWGVVSEQAAGQMAIGVSKKSRAQVGVGVTGIAGPTGATEAKPIGMVCFGFCINGNVSTYTMHFGNVGRNKVRCLSVDFVFEKLMELL